MKLKRFQIIAVLGQQGSVEGEFYVFGKDEEDARLVFERQNPSYQVKEIKESL